MFCRVRSPHARLFPRFGLLISLGLTRDGGELASRAGVAQYPGCSLYVESLAEANPQG